MKNRRVNKGYYFPPVSVIISALNEEKYLKRKIDNLLDQDYPSKKIEIIIISDGSIDNTEQIVKSFQKLRPDIKLHSFGTRRGKAFAINYGVSKAKGSVLVFTDARQVFEPNAVKELVANFHDGSVGAVSGELFLTTKESRISETIRLYWNYEKWIRKSESRIDSVVGATGAIYAIRKELYEDIPGNTILDDLFIPMKAVFKGYRVVFDEKAVAYDDISTDSKKEFKRKVRTLTGNFQILSLMPELLLARKNRIFFHYFSHKVTRLIAPFFFLMLLASNLYLTHGTYMYFLAVQLLFYSAAIWGLFSKAPGKKYRFIYIPTTFFILNYAVVLGFVNFITNNEYVWDK